MKAARGCQCKSCTDWRAELEGLVVDPIIVETDSIEKVLTMIKHDGSASLPVPVGTRVKYRMKGCPVNQEFSFNAWYRTTEEQRWNACESYVVHPEDAAVIAQAEGLFKKVPRWTFENGQTWFFHDGKEKLPVPEGTRVRFRWMGFANPRDTNYLKEFPILSDEDWHVVAGPGLNHEHWSNCHSYTIHPEDVEKRKIPKWIKDAPEYIHRLVAETVSCRAKPSYAMRESDINGLPKLDIYRRDENEEKPTYVEQQLKQWWK